MRLAADDGNQPGRGRRRLDPFFYASARYLRETNWDRVNKIGSTLPDEVRDGRELSGKLTGTPNERNQINVSFRDRPNHVDNAGIGSSSAASVATTTDNGSRIFSGSWAVFPSAQLDQTSAIST